jgi:1-aminocyclopropane-1-carboxylate deaminase/D-cysteine desulfhydrase-like pyridoxal-dependent ACC family enzyme
MATELTPVEKHGAYWFKRDDLFEIAGVRGGKVRTCYALAKDAKVGLTTAGSRSSPQVNIVANIAKHLGLPCVAHTPTGALNKELELAREAGCFIIQHKAGYNNVITSRSKEYAFQTGYTDIPFGMEHDFAVVETMAQVRNVPREVKRIVMPVGGGMSLAGVLHGVKLFRPNLHVIGVMVGADPRKRLTRWAPMGWQFMCTLVAPREAYDDYVPTYLDIPFTLDPVYEAKCQEFLQAGDLMWCVGIRQSYLKP